eukprot:m.147719 g.147719  ORF g.147719 m.147719 type:complete len:298 (+) comp38471_c0_seq1:224-1117(+)
MKAAVTVTLAAFFGSLALGDSKSCSEDSIQIPYVDKDCSPNLAGSLRYNVRADEVQYCNGEEWISFVVHYSVKFGTKDKPAISCLALSKLNGHRAGVYWIKPSSHYPSFKTYCTEDGYTLIMKIDGSKQTFSYGSSLWTSKTALNEHLVAFDNNEAKLPSFWTLPFSQLRLEMTAGHARKHVTLQKSAKSFYHIMFGSRYHPTNIGRNTWKSLIPDSSLQPHCNKEGFNVRLGNSVRIGILSNQENDCLSPDSFIGFGVQSTSCRRDFRPNSCGNMASCTPDNGDKNIFAMGYIFAR